MLLCPRCRSPLSTERGGRGLAFLCQRGHGRAVAVQVARRRIVPDVIADLWRRTRAAQERIGPPCPACNRPMAEVAPATRGAPVVLDACERCQLVWFDPGELESLPPAPAPPPDGASLSPEATEAAARLVIARLAPPEGPCDDGWAEQLLAATGVLLPMKRGAPPRRATPRIVRGLALVLVGIHVAAVLGAGFPRGLPPWAKTLGFLTSAPWRHAGATWVTSFFFHSGLGHVLGNAYFLILAGEDVEALLGRARLAALLVLGTITGNLLFLLAHGEGDVLLVGASGGISALFGWYALALPQVEIGLVGSWTRGSWSAAHPGFAGLRVRWVFGLWVLWQGLLLLLAPRSTIAGAAHLGGALAGVVWWFASRRGASPRGRVSGAAPP